MVELRRRGDIEGEAIEHWCRGEIGSEVVELRCRGEIGCEAVELSCRLTLEVKRWILGVGAWRYPEEDSTKCNR